MRKVFKPRGWRRYRRAAAVNARRVLSPLRGKKALFDAVVVAMQSDGAERVERAARTRLESGPPRVGVDAPSGRLSRNGLRRIVSGKPRRLMGTRPDREKSRTAYPMETPDRDTRSAENATEKIARGHPRSRP